MRVGFVDPTLWFSFRVIGDPDPALIQQQREGMSAALRKIEELGRTIIRDAPFSPMDQLVLHGEDALG